MEEKEKAHSGDLLEGAVLIVMLLVGIVLLFFRGLVANDVPYEESVAVVVWSAAFFINLLFEANLSMKCPDAILGEKKRFFFLGEAVSCAIALALAAFCWGGVIQGDAASLCFVIAALLVGYPMYIAKLILQIRKAHRQGAEGKTSMALAIFALSFVGVCLVLGIVFEALKIHQALFVFLCMPLFLLLEKGMGLE